MAYADCQHNFPNNNGYQLGHFNPVHVFWNMLLMASSLALPLALSHFVAKDSIGAAFHFRGWGNILLKNKWEYFVTWILVTGVMVLLYTIITLMYYSVVLCCLIPWVLPPVLLYTVAIYSALFGQIYREATRKHV